MILSEFVLLLVAVFHFFRLVYHWRIVVGSRTIPFELSYLELLD